MATTITDLPEYSGTLPNKDTQTQSVFDGAADTWLTYEYGQLIPAINGSFVSQINILSNELEIARNSVAVNAILSQNYSVSSSNSATSAAVSASSVATSLTAVNAILGLGIGTSYLNSEGNLIFYYDDGTVTAPPVINSEGNLILQIEV